MSRKAKRLTDFRVFIKGMTNERPGMLGPYYLPTEKAARSFAGIRSQRVIERIEPGGGWKEIHRGADKKPEKVAAK